VQARIKDELRSAGLLKEGPNSEVKEIELDDLTSLTYLNAVINEGMRLHPAAALGSIR